MFFNNHIDVIQRLLMIFKNSTHILSQLQHMGGFLNNSQIEFFLANWEVVFFLFLDFSHEIYSMYVPKGMCMVGHTGNPSQGAGGLFYP